MQRGEQFSVSVFYSGCCELAKLHTEPLRRVPGLSIDKTADAGSGVCGSNLWGLRLAAEIHGVHRKARRVGSRVGL